MKRNERVVIAGLGEVGRALYNVLSRTFDCIGIDVDPVSIERPVDVLHICYPFQIPNYIQTTAEYVRMLRPALTIINTTLPPGITRQVQNEIPETMVAFSPVRGKHVRMEVDLMHYTKFVAASDPAAARAAIDHFSTAGFDTRLFASPEIGELAKLLETTYLGMLIAWAQEMERLAAQYGGRFEDVNCFVEEVGFLPSHIYPGVIGGHCVMPNIELLRSRVESPFLDLVVESNELKMGTPAAVGEGVSHA